MQPGRVTARQIEAARRALVRHIRRQGKVWIRVFPDVPVSQKPTEVRMGKGKGSPNTGCAGQAWAGSCSRWTACSRTSPRPLSRWPRPSCRSDPGRVPHRRRRIEKEMKAEDLRQKTPDELSDELASLRKEQFNLRFQAASGQLENTARVREVRRDIARIKTIMNERTPRASA